MSDLVCIAFDDPNAADRCLDTLRSLSRQNLIDLEDACVVTVDESGRAHLKQAFPRMGVGARVGGISGAMMGILIGFCLLNPVGGLAVGSLVGTGFGAAAGKSNDYGIDDDFIKKVSSELRPQSSALFVLFWSVTAAKVLPELHSFKGRIVQTSLSAEREQRLRMALAATVAEQAGLASTQPPVPKGE